MRKILIDKDTGDIISVGARNYTPEEGQVVYDLTKKINYNSRLQKNKQFYDTSTCRLKKEDKVDNG